MVALNSRVYAIGVSVIILRHGGGSGRFIYRA
jgi:hypothetical protein